MVVAIRGDHYERLAAFPFLAALSSTTVLVRAMRDDEIRRVVVEPAERHGYPVEPALVEAVLDEVSGQPGALPLLSPHWCGRGRTAPATASPWPATNAVAASAPRSRRWPRRLTRPSRRGPSAARRLLLRMAGLQGQTWSRRPVPLDEIDVEDEPPRPR